MKAITIFLFIFQISSFCFAQDLEMLTEEKYKTLFLDKKQDSINQLLIGTKAKDFKFKTMKGDSIQLSDVQGQPVVITIFFCVCAPCLDEIPLINQLAIKYTNQNVTFIAISTQDTPEIIEVMGQFSTREDKSTAYIDEITVVAASYTGEAYRNPQDEDFKNETKDFLRENYLVDSAPMTFFIDKKGIIRFISSGYSMKYDYFPFYQTKIEALLKE